MIIWLNVVSTKSKRIVNMNCEFIQNQLNKYLCVVAAWFRVSGTKKKKKGRLIVGAPRCGRDLLRMHKYTKTPKGERWTQTLLEEDIQDKQWLNE